MKLKTFISIAAILFFLTGSAFASSDSGTGTSDSSSSSGDSSNSTSGDSSTDSSRSSSSNNMSADISKDSSSSSASSNDSSKESTSNSADVSSGSNKSSSDNNRLSSDNSSTDTSNSMETSNPSDVSSSSGMDVETENGMVVIKQRSSTDNEKYDPILERAVKGRILLQVQSNGEAWYVDPVSEKVIYLGRPADAFRIMREMGLGIKNSDLEKIPIAGNGVSGQTNALAKRLAGRILLQVEDNGEAWYVDPVTLTREYLGRPADAYYLMREKGLGITDNNLDKLGIAR